MSSPGNPLKKSYDFVRRNYVISIPVIGVLVLLAAKIIFPTPPPPPIYSKLHILYLDKTDVTNLVRSVSGNTLGKVIFKFVTDASGNLTLEYHRGSRDYSAIEPTALHLKFGAEYPVPITINPGNFSFSDEELVRTDDGGRDNIQKLRNFLNGSYTFITFSPAVDTNGAGDTYITYTLGVTNVNPTAINNTNQINDLATSGSTKLKPTPPYKSN